MHTSELADYDLYLFHQGTNFHSHELLGAHFINLDGKSGVRFAVWAKHAKSVSVVGDFNHWDTRVHKMTRLADGETWAIFIEGLAEGDTYKYAIETSWGEVNILEPIRRIAYLYKTDKNIHSREMYRLSNEQFMQFWREDKKNIRWLAVYMTDGRKFVYSALSNKWAEVTQR